MRVFSLSVGNSAIQVLTATQLNDGATLTGFNAIIAEGDTAAEASVNIAAALAATNAGAFPSAGTKTPGAVLNAGGSAFSCPVRGEVPDTWVLMAIALQTGDAQVSVKLW